jgi:hypothetical protein
MEVILKLTDIAENHKPKDGDTEPRKVTATDAIDEAMTLTGESIRSISRLIEKGRKKIDLVGEVCNVEILIKE